MWKLWTDNSEHIQRLVQCIGTFATITVAWICLTTWRRQLSGTTRFNNAARLLLLANRIRDTIIAERGNPAPLNWHDGVPEHTPENIAKVEQNLGDERVYLTAQIARCHTTKEELHETIPAVDGILPVDVRPLTQDLKRCVERWQEALEASVVRCI